MNILVINGNTKTDGFIAGALDIAVAALEQKKIDVDDIRLFDAKIKDCIGCFHCLKTGDCVHQDDMKDLMQKMIAADGFIVGSPVRNGLVTACYKRFYERITYTLGFPLLLEDKHTLAISSVGAGGGKKVNKTFLGLQDVCHTRLSGYLFFKVGIPTKLNPENFKEKIESEVDLLVSNIENRTPKSTFDKATAALDRQVMNTLLLKKSPSVYANVIKHWKQKNYM